VVDDEPTLCTLTARALRECGHEVVAADGIAAYNWPALSRSTWW
jgi:CheY-like chemotaxis protein